MVSVSLDVAENVIGVAETASICVWAEVLNPASPTDGLFSYDLNLELSHAGVLAIDPDSIEQPDTEDPQSPGTAGPTGLAQCYGVYFQQASHGIGIPKELVRLHAEGLAPGTVTLTVTPDTLIGADFTLHESDDLIVDYTAAVGAVRVGIRADLVWTAATDNTWDREATTNWSESGTPCTYRLGDHVTFNDTAPPGPPVAIAAEMTPGSVTVNNTTRNYAFEGPGSVGGSCGLVKEGIGTLNLATANPYTGDTLIEAGTLVAATDGALGSGSSTVFLGNTSGEDDACLLVAGPHVVDRDILVQDDGSVVSIRMLGGTNTAGTAVFGGDVRLNKNLLLTAEQGGEVRFNGVLDNSEGRTLTKIGGGTVVFEGRQNHGPGSLLHVVEGLVVLSSDASGTGLADDAHLSILVAGAELRFGSNQRLDTLTIGDGGLVQFAGANVVVVKHLLMNGVDLGATTLVPEPATLGLLAAGTLGFMFRKRGNSVA